MFSCYQITKGILKAYVWAFSLQSSVSGNYPLPAGPKIIAANHPNATDSFQLPFLFSEKLHFLMRSPLFTLPVIGWLLTGSGQIAVGFKDGKNAFREACNLLRSGETVVIYPEGRLNPEERTVRAGSGAVRMSLETGAPIIPLGIHVASRHLVDMRLHLNGRLSKGRWQVSGSCFLRFGNPWCPARAIHEHRANVHMLSEELMQRVYDLVSEITHKEAGCESPALLSPIPQS